MWPWRSQVFALGYLHSVANLDRAGTVCQVGCYSEGSSLAPQAPKGYIPSASHMQMREAKGTFSYLARGSILKPSLPFFIHCWRCCSCRIRRAANRQGFRASMSSLSHQEHKLQGLQMHFIHAKKMLIYIASYPR